MGQFGYHIMNKCPQCGNRDRNGIDMVNNDGIPSQAVCYKCNHRFLVKAPIVGLFSYRLGGQNLHGIVDYAAKELMTVGHSFVAFRKIEDVEKEIKEAN